jgi:DNA polymerase-3 subunit delta'
MNDLYPWLTAYRDWLGSRLEQDGIPHGLLITGQPGVGKMALATALAGLLLCEQRGSRDSVCGHCEGCRSFAAGAHPDYVLVTQEVDEKTGKQAASIKVDQIRELAEKLTLSSHRTGYKVVLLAPAETLNINAANSLLKTLEEPTDNTVLVLVCASPARLPATIRSRCQQLRITVPEARLAEAWLTERLPGVDAGRYLQLAGGAPLEALRLAEGQVIEARREQLQSLVDVLEGKAEPLAIASVWGRDEQLQPVLWLRDWLMDLLRIRMTGSTGSIRSVDLEDLLARLAPRLDPRELFRQLEQINQALRIRDGILNRQLMTEEILLSWAAMK